MEEHSNGGFSCGAHPKPAFDILPLFSAGRSRKLTLVPIIQSLAQLEKNLKGLSSVTDILKDGHTPEDLLAVVLRDMDMKILGQKDVRFACHCSKEKGYRALATLGKKELQELLDEGKGAEANCEFCGKNYCYSTDDIKNILIELSKKA